jgi:regulator of RNase E activity RraA
LSRALTVLEADCATTRIASQDRDAAFGLMFEALDSLQPGELYVCTGSGNTYACWGELMSTRARHCGAVGAVIEGYSRDTHGIRRLDFPTFSHGPYGQDQGVRGRVIDYRCPIEFSNGVRVLNGDLLVGDIDGVVAIPQDVEKETIERALQKVRGRKYGG